MRRLRRTLVLAVAAVAAGAVVVTALADRTPERKAATATDREPPEAATLPEAPAPAFSVPRPRRLHADEERSLFAPLRHATIARARPDPAAPVVARLSTRTPEGTSSIVLALERKRSAGRLWIRVRLPVLPNNSTGWVRRSALGGYGVVSTRLVVDRASLTASLYRDRRLVFQAPVGVGSARWPTPTGEFFIRNKLTRFESPFYGPLAFGTSARSAVLTDWPAGGFVGIHGTNRPELLPGRVSHGCIRMRNEDILRLGELMPVGTPLTIR